MGPILEIKIIWLLIIVTSIAILGRKVKLPYTVALVAAGLGLGFFHIISGIHLTPDLLFFLFLPGLLFEAAFHLDIRDFKKNAWAIIILAVPGVIFTMLAVGGIVALGLKWTGYYLIFPVGYAMLFGSLIAATDPISVLFVFEKLGISKKLTVIIEGESLFNDGTAVVIFGIVLSALAGGEFTVGGGISDFFIVVAGGIGVGALLGLAMSVITAQVDDHLIEITLTTILAYGSYLVAEELHVSGVISVVVAGMMSGNFGTKYGMSPTTKLAVTSFWEYVVFVVNSVVFVLIGIELSVAHLLDNIVPVLIAWGAVLISRIFVIYIVRPIVNRLGSNISWRWAGVLVWGGIRGSISMVLVLSLPQDFPHRELILSMTFGVVSITLLGQGMTMRPILKWLKLVVTPKWRESYEKYRGSLVALGRVMTELEEMSAEKTISPGVFKKLKEEYQKKVEGLERGIGDLDTDIELLEREESIATKRHLLMVEKDAIKSSYSGGIISREVADDLTREVDIELEMLEREED